MRYTGRYVASYMWYKRVEQEEAQSAGHRRDTVVAEESRCGTEVGVMQYPRVTFSARLNLAASAGSLLSTASDAGYPAPILVPIQAK